MDVNDILRIIQGALIGLVLSLVGYDFTTWVFWLCMVIQALQWIKEIRGE